MHRNTVDFLQWLLHTFVYKVVLVSIGERFVDTRIAMQTQVAPSLQPTTGHTINIKVFCTTADSAATVGGDICRLVRLFIPRTSRVASNSFTAQQHQELQPLMQGMLAAVQGQTQNRDVAAMDAAFASFRSALCSQQYASTYCVRLDLDTLSALADVQTWRPGTTCVATALPHGLHAIQHEITELHVNCAIWMWLPDWVYGFENLQVLCLDGESSFQRSPVTHGKANPEFVNNAHGWNKTPKYMSKIKALPECLGSLVSLTTLSLERMDALVTLPSSLSQITGL